MRVLITLLLLSAWLAVPAHAAPVVIDRLEAFANSSTILLSDIRKFRRNVKLRAQLDPLFAWTSIASKGENATDTEITDFLIDEKLITQQFPLSDSEVEQEINKVQSMNHIDRATLKKALDEQGFAFEDYFELIRSGASKRNLIERDIRTKVAISDDDVKNYFYNHYSKSASTPMAYQIQLVVVSTKSFKTPSAAREAAQRALKDLRGGDSFEEVAKRFSDDASASGGGDVGVVTEDQMSPAMRDQVKKLKIGQISEVFGSPSSAYYILKLKDIKTGDSDRLEKMKGEIREQLTVAEHQHQVALWLERQRQIAFIHKAGLSAR